MSRASSISAQLYRMIWIEFEFRTNFVLVLENTLGPSAVTHYNKNTATNFHLPSGLGASHRVPSDCGGT